MAGSDLSLDDARRVAVAAQGFGGRRRTVTRADVLRVIDRLHVIQIDPISVVVRTQYMPAYSRLGPYRRGDMDRLVDQGALFQAMAHDASLVSLRHYPLLRWRRDAVRRDPRWRPYVEGDAVTRLLDEITARGPSTGAELETAKRVPRERPAAMWSMSPTRRLLRWMWVSGQIVVVGRRGMEQIYDLPERAIPEALRTTDIEANDARRRLLAIAAGALGVGTARDLADYFRLGTGVAGHADRSAGALTPVPTLLAELVEGGELVECRVDGWRQPAYMPAGSRPRRRQKATCLLSPFDSLIWFRERVARLFTFHYRIEIYVPAAKREHGYYVLPFLHDGRLVGRVDLKADKKLGALVVHRAAWEPGARTDETIEALASELRTMAGWLDLDEVQVRDRGRLQAAIRSISAKLPE